MPIARQDAWSLDEDLLLAEVVLRHIREGSTQLKAFEEVGEQLSRTAAACGFRWNSYVRKQYKSGIELAKKHRKEKSLHVVKPAGETERVAGKSREQDVSSEDEKEQHAASRPICLQDIISYLMKMDESLRRDSEEGIWKEERAAGLEQENVSLKEEIHVLKEKLEAVQEDYHALLKIMDRARKLSVLEDEKENQKVSFQMDKNGNLERVNK